MFRHCLASFLLLLLAAFSLDAGGKKPDSAFAPVSDDPKLPRVLLIGDSISIGYTLPVRELLKAKANVHRIPENGGPTSNGLKKIDQWVGEKKWDVIHFNWGLHDLKMDAAGKHQVPLADYEKNLDALVKKMKSQAKVLVWCSTTPVPDGKVSPSRKNSDVIAFNAAAKKVMEANGVALNDLYAVALPKLTDVQKPANVHFTEAGSRVLAAQVVAALEKALK